MHADRLNHKRLHGLAVHSELCRKTDEGGQNLIQARGFIQFQKKCILA